MGDGWDLFIRRGHVRRRLPPACCDPTTTPPFSLPCPSELRAHASELLQQEKAKAERDAKKKERAEKKAADDQK